LSSNSEQLAKFEQLRKDFSGLQNKIKDLEMENEKLKENADYLTIKMNESNKIDDLERENRKLKSDVEFLK